MLARLKSNKRLKETTFLLFTSIACVTFLFYRMDYCNSQMFLFLIWNLFLASIPWILTSIAILYPEKFKSKISIFLLLASWLLFFPNAPYILTDLFHLKHNLKMPIWFDLILVLSFAWTGILFGFFSLWDLERIIKERFGGKFISLLSTFLLFLGSFGIYLGRYLRWNSWDIVQKPGELFSDIGTRFLNPAEHPRAWGMTLFLGFFLNLIYWSFRLLKKRA